MYAKTKGVILIKRDPISRQLITLDYLLSLILFLFGLATANIWLALSSIGVVLILIVGQNLVETFGVLKDTGARQNPLQSKKQAYGTGVWLPMAIFGFVAIDVATPKLFAVPFYFKFAIPGLSSLATSSDALIAFLLLTQIGISEEVLFREAAANYFGRTSPLAGVLMSGILFGVFHVPVYGGDLVTLAIVIASGWLIAFVDIQNGGTLYTGMLAHQINNAATVLYLLATAGLVPTASPQVVAVLGFGVLAVTKTDTFRFKYGGKLEACGLNLRRGITNGRASFLTLVGIIGGSAIIGILPVQMLGGTPHVQAQVPQYPVSPTLQLASDGKPAMWGHPTMFSGALYVNGGPIAAAPISVYYNGTLQQGIALHTGADGTFRFTQIWAGGGTYVVTVQSSGLKSSPVTVKVGAA